MKGELGGKIMKEFITLRPKTTSFLLIDGHVDKRIKDICHKIINHI